MPTFTPIRTKTGWRCELGDLVTDADSPRLDRGAIRATLTIRQKRSIKYRDTVNLTSARARAAVVQALTGKKIALDEGVLVALDEACRTRREPPREEWRGEGSDVSGTPPLDLPQLEASFTNWLLIEDAAFIPVLVGSILAHRLGGDPVWLLVVAPPGGTKSEIIRSLYDYPGMFPLSDLTARTFASGLDVKGVEPSLLARLDDEVLVLKDFTTVLEMHREERQAILAQLREIYDGRFDKVWGTGRELHWTGRLGFIAGVTPVIDRYHGVMSVLGERFVLFRLVMPDRKQLATAALRSSGKEREMREALNVAMRGFLAARRVYVPEATVETLDTIATVANFITRARSGVVRDGYKRELEYAPEPEAPTRFAKVLLALARGIAVAYDSSTVTTRELRLVLRVALDCLPVIRQRVIGTLVQGAITEDEEGALSTTKIAGAAQFSTTAIRRTLEDLQALDVVTCRKSGKGFADQWVLLPHWSAIFEGLAAAANQVNGGAPDESGTVPETSDPPPYAGNGMAADPDGEEEVAEWRR